MHFHKSIDRYNGGQTAAHIDRRFYSQGEERKENGTWVSYYYCRDHLGSIREVVKGDSSLAARYDYDPYGLRLTRYQAASYTNCDFGYTGHITQHSPVSGQSEIVLTLYRAYDPVHARWLTPAPIGEAGGLNLYEYCLGNPMSFRDPDGMLPWGMENWDMSDWMGVMLTPDELADSARIGVGATVDGIVPFADPMKNSLGTYNDCETGAKESRFLGELSRDIGMMAAGAPISGSKRFVIQGAAKGTNYAGIFARAALQKLRLPKKLPFRIPTPVGYTGTMRKTNDLERIIGRYAPVPSVANQYRNFINNLEKNCE
jgi:RHS repeat-associated protein